MSTSDRALARIGKMFRQEFSTSFSVADFVWKYLSDEDRRIGLSRPLSDFEAIHQGFRKEIKKLPVAEVGEKVNLADELKIYAADEPNRSVLIEEWLIRIDRELSALPDWAPPIKPVTPDILIFVADKSQVSSGESVVLRWTTKDATSVVLEGLSESGTVLWSRVVEKSGEWTVRDIRQTSLFRLQAIHGVVIVPRRIRVLMKVEAPASPPEPPSTFGFESRSQPEPTPRPTQPERASSSLAITRFTVEPSTIRRGSTVEVCWAVTAASSVTLEHKLKSGKSLARFDVPLSGAHRFINLRNAATIELMGFDLHGNRVLQSAHVELRALKWPWILIGGLLFGLLLWTLMKSCAGPSKRPPSQPPARTGSNSREDSSEQKNQSLLLRPEISSFQVETLHQTGSVTARVTWSAKGTHALLNRSPVELSGVRDFVNPAPGAKFTLVVTAGGNTTRRTELFEGVDSTPRSPDNTPAKAAIDFFGASQDHIDKGQTVRLYWSVKNANTVSIDKGIGEVKGGEVTVRPDETTRYTLSARGATNIESKMIEITVDQPKTVSVSPEWPSVSPSVPLSGVLQCPGTAVPPNGSLSFDHLPAGRLHFDVDPPGSWYLLTKKQEDGTQRLTLVSKLSTAQTRCTVHWKVVP